MADKSQLNAAMESIPKGYSTNDPAVQDMFEDIHRKQKTVKGYIEAGIMGAAAGGQAAQGFSDPYAAFIQGAAAGMQVPAALYQKRSAELRNALDAAPLSKTMPELVYNDPADPSKGMKPGYEIFASMPTKLAQQAIAQIGQDAIRLKMDAESKEKLATIDEASAKAYSKMAAEAGVDIKPEDILGARKQDVADFVRLSASNAAALGNEKRKENAADLKQKQLDEKAFFLLDRLANPTTAMRGSALGMAGQNNLRADRAIGVLKNPAGMTTQDKDMVTTDLAGIMQGGVPHEQELRSQGYGTYWDNFKVLSQKILQKPALLDQPEIKAKLLDAVKTLKEADNRIIENNLSTLEASHADLINRNPDKWLNMKKAILKQNTYTGEDGGNFVIREINGKKYKFDPATKQNLGAI